MVGSKKKSERKPPPTSSPTEDVTQPISPPPNVPPTGAASITRRRTVTVKQADKTVAVTGPLTMDQEKFDKRFGYRRINISMGRRVYYHFKKIKRWNGGDWWEFAKNRLPIMRWLPEYQKEYAVRDIIGGLMVSVMSVPQGLAYGYLAGVQPIYGLYTSIYMSIVYVIFGSSRHTAPGAFAIISMMVGSVVAAVQAIESGDLGEDDKNETSLYCCTPPHGDSSNAQLEKNVDVATSVTLLVGMWQIILGLFNTGIFAVYLSDYLVKGLMSGAAIHVITSQLKTMTGLTNLPPTSDYFCLIKFYSCFFPQLGRCNYHVVIISVVSMAALLISCYVIDPLLQRCKCKSFKFPMELIVVVATTSVMFALRKTGNPLYKNVPVVGEIKFGLAYPAVPSLRHAKSMMAESISIAVISFAIHIALAKMIAKELSYDVNSNQEWFALGAMHSISSFFGCFAGGSSLGRSMMQVKFGTQTQLSTFICAIVLLVFVFGASRLIEDLPKAVLAAIVCVALKDLVIQIVKMRNLYKQSVFDYLIFYITFLSVVILNVNMGLIVGIAFALLTVVFRSQWPESMCVGRIPGTNDFKGFGQYRLVEEIEGMRVFRFEAPIYFANAELFLTSVYSAVGVDPVRVLAESQKQSRKEEKQKLKKRDEEKGREETVEEERQGLVADGDEDLVEMQLSHIIIDCSAVPYVDLMGKEAMTQLACDYEKIGIGVFYAHCKVAVRQFLESSNFHEKVPKTRLFVKIDDAIEQAQMEKQESQNSQMNTLVLEHSKTNTETEAMKTALPIPEKEKKEGPKQANPKQRIHVLKKKPEDIAPPTKVVGKPKPDTAKKNPGSVRKKEAAKKKTVEKGSKGSKKKPVKEDKKKKDEEPNEETAVVDVSPPRKARKDKEGGDSSTATKNPPVDKTQQDR